MDSGCGLSKHGDNQGKCPPAPSSLDSERAGVVEFLPLRPSATLRETGCFALLGWCSGISPSGTLWQLIKSGGLAGHLRLFAA